MTRIRRLVFAVAALAVLGAACSRTLGGAPEDLEDAGALTPPVNPIRDAAPADALGATTAVRFAHLAPYGAIDFCYRKAATDEFVGPLFGPADAAAPDGSDASPGGIGRLVVTGYFPLVGAGTFHFNLVRGGSISCANPVATGDVTLEAGRYSTLVVGGKRWPGDASADGGQNLDAAVAPDVGAIADAGNTGDAGATNASLSIAAYVDDLSVDNGKARARFVHTAFGDGPAPVPDSLSIDAVGPDGTTALAAKVDPSKVSATGTSPAVDGRGYVTVGAQSDPIAIHFAELVDASARSWATLPTRLYMTAGSIHTAFVASEGADLRVVWCDDVATGASAKCEALLAQ